MRISTRILLAAGLIAVSAPALSEPLFSAPSLVDEARKYMGTNPTGRKKLWCATFMNMVLAKAGYAGTNSDAARSFAYYGRRITEPRVGAIAVLRRGRHGGHVGVVAGIDGHGNPIIISGNHNHRVGEGVYPRARVIAYVMPSGRHAAGTQVASRAASDATGGIDSPIAELIAAIEAEQARSDHAGQPASARPAGQAATDSHFDIDPVLADLLGGTKAPAQAAPHPQQAVRPQPAQRQLRQQRVQQLPGRIASNAATPR